MKSKISWIVVIFLPIILFFFISFKTIKDIYIFFSINQKAVAHVESYQIREYKKNKYKALITYSFKVNDKIFVKKNFFRKIFLNQFNADEFVSKISKENFYIWFNKKNPNFSSLEKTFPIKNCVYLSITLLIFFYFIILKYYVYTIHRSD